MLSAAYVSLNQASTYYQKDNYYTKQLGEYRGKLKEELGLGDLTHASFQALIRGVNPSSGESLIASKTNKNKGRAAIDLTFTAPKSLSILLEIAEAKKNNELTQILMQAHDDAVNRALTHIENEYAETRIQKNGKRNIEKTGNLLFAKFQHDTSRELDTLLHTHCPAFNFTKCKDGKYRSLEAKQLLKDQVKNGLFYRSELAINLQKAGIEIEITDKEKGFYEIRGIGKELLKEFSGRRAQIEKKVKDLRKKFPKMSKTKIYQKATLQSRKSKKEVDRDQIRSKNLARAEKIADIDKLLSKFQISKHDQIITKDSSLKKEVQAIVTQIQKEVKKLPRYRQTQFAVANGVAKRLLGKLPASAIYKDVIQKQNEDKKALTTMHQVVISTLKNTKLDTNKLFTQLENLKNTPKIQIEEVIENVRKPRDTGRNNRVVAIGSDYQQSDTPERSKRSDFRGSIESNRDINTGVERERREGTELERNDGIADRNDSSNFRKNQKQGGVSLKDIRIAEQGYRESQKAKQKEQNRD